MIFNNYIFSKNICILCRFCMCACTHITAIANKNCIWGFTSLFINGENKPSQVIFVPAVKYQIIHDLGLI